VKTYVDTISSGAVPCLENAVIAMAMIENEAAVKEGLEVYQSGMEKLKDSFPVELNEITLEHQCFSLMATQTFMKRCFRDHDGKYLTSLEVGGSCHTKLCHGLSGWKVCNKIVYCTGSFESPFYIKILFSLKHTHTCHSEINCAAYKHKHSGSQKLNKIGLLLNSYIVFLNN